MAKIIDISQPLAENVPVWPGDEPFSFGLKWTKAESGSVNVGTITMSAHTGTHIDAPYHFDDDGKRVIDLEPELYFGPARVIEVFGHDSLGASELKDHDLTGIVRVLIKTGSWNDRESFPETITYLRKDAAQYLADQGIRLIGLDVPSVDPIDSKTLDAHHSLHDHGINILEGAVLDHVQPGDYELSALPLPLKDADGSPVRAVLKTYE